MFPRGIFTGWKHIATRTKVGLILGAIFFCTLAVAGPSILSVYQGGTGLNAVAAHQVFVGTASNVFTAKTLPDCQDTGGNHYNYAQSSDTWSCGNSVGGGGSSFGCESACSYILASPDMNFLNAFSNGTSAISFALATANRAEFIRIFNNIGRTLGNPCISIITASAGGHADVGMYSLIGTAGTLQWHTGSFSTTSTGVQCFTPTPYVMSGGANFYVAWCADNTTVQLAALAASNSGVSANVLSSGSIHTFGVDSTDTCTAGVLPASITTTNITNTAVQMVLPYVNISN